MTERPYCGTCQYFDPWGEGRGDLPSQPTDGDRQADRRLTPLGSVANGTVYGLVWAALCETGGSNQRMRQRIYISGPLTSSGNVEENLDRAMDAARALIAAGFAPFCPHLTYRVDPGETIPHATWMEIELPWVAVADALLRLPGESLGADIEAVEARRLGIPVFAAIADLVGHFTVAGAQQRRSDSEGRLCERYQTSTRAAGTHRANPGGPTPQDDPEAIPA